MAANQDGHIFGVSDQGDIFHIGSDGTLINSTRIENEFLSDIDINECGQIIIASARNSGVYFTDASLSTINFLPVLGGLFVAFAPRAPQELEFDICIEDDSSGNFLQINSTTGDYQFTNCNGFTGGGTGSLTTRGCTITLQDTRSDRRVLARIDTCQNRATASIQIFSQGATLTITDRNTTNNLCACR